MKLISFYLPQFHEIPENNQWWGKGFTEWSNVKKAVPLFHGHLQPRVPLNNNYYDLSDINVMREQVKLAKDSGMFGFCFYHYWFDGRLLLQKPIEQFLENKDIDFHFCICWANEHWTKAWESDKNTVLIEQKYGNEEEWKSHFDYLLPYFKDYRYIVENNKPMIVIYRPDIIPCLNKMLDFWNALAVENGFDGLCFCYQHPSFGLMKKKDDSRFTYCIEYQPTYAQSLIRNKKHKLLRRLKHFLDHFFETFFKKDLRYLSQKKGPTVFDYDEVWTYIINSKPISSKSIPGAFVNWDNTPRRGKTGIYYVGYSTEKFEKYLSLQIKHAKEDYHTEYVFLFAWNEWGEGGFLEPDEKEQYGRLNAVKKAIKNNDE